MKNTAQKYVKILVSSHPLENLEVTHSSSMALWKAHCRLPISDNWSFFASCYGWGTIKRNRSFL